MRVGLVCLCCVGYVVVNSCLLALIMGEVLALDGSAPCALIASVRLVCRMADKAEASGSDVMRQIKVRAHVCSRQGCSRHVCSRSAGIG